MRLFRGVIDFLIAAAVLLAMSVAVRGLVRGSSLAGPEELRAGRTQQQATQQPSNGSAQSQTPAPTAASTESAKHIITLTFDYDFTKTPACSATVKVHCVAKFSVYDISGHKPYFLFFSPVPSGAHGVVKGITATSPQLLFAVGKHRIAVSAVEPDGSESPPHECKTIIEIKPTAAADTSAAH
ncbi:MAG: hypothetical protein WA197_05700 [Candidatus Acidiferrales bacterium]